MKLKSLLLTGLFATASATVNAQTILKGDMNDDEKVTIADVTSLVNVILGKAPQETINVGGSPYMVDNTSVVGTWYAPDGSSFTLNEDGTTNYGTGFTYKFRPYQGTLMIFNTSGAPVKTFVLNEVESSYLLAVNYATGTYTYYTNSGSLATGITLDQTSLEMNSGTTAQLTPTLSPEGAFGNVTWSSSDESVATVDANGVVTAVAGGTCTITATTGGSLKTATCSVTVKQLVQSITLSSTTDLLELELDGYVRLTATVLPDNAANKNVVWSSSNEDVASVRNGRVDAYGYGTAVITCTAQDGSGVSASIRVVVPEVVTVNGISFNMIKVEGGTFQMGQAGAVTPVHQVTLTNDYYIGETEVTQELWTAVMGSNPSRFTNSNQLPVEKVSWDDCQTFINKLNELTGRSFRLPTEAEWEFAARGGNASKGYTYSGSDTLDDVAWYRDNSNSQTHEVATKAPNELGIYDMSGNVWEWCQDRYGSYSSSAQTNPTGPTSGSNRVNRGGSCMPNAWGAVLICRVFHRSWGSASYADSDLGLRLAF